MKFLVVFALVAGVYASAKECPANSHYQECGTACPRTCKNYNDPPKPCVQMCVEGCFCDDGYVKTEDGRCIEPEQCSNEKNCVDKPDRGACLGYFTMWYYDEDAKTCKQFIYGGCQGNGNRYVLKLNCMRKCADKSIWKIPSPKADSDRCSLPAETGLCRGYFPRYYFDKASGQCKEFIYGGCGGNENNFKSEDECASACGSRYTEACGENEFYDLCGTNCPLTCENYDQRPLACDFMCKRGCECVKGFIRGPGGKCIKPEACPNRKGLPSFSREICNLEKDAGPCRAFAPRFFFNRKTGQCEQFIYGGCQGNDNNFSSQRECENRCLV